MNKATWLFLAVAAIVAGCAADKSTYTVDKSRVSAGVSISDHSGGAAPVPTGGKLKLVKMVPPDYPRSLRKANITGVVWITHTVLPDGHVENVRVKKSAGEQLDRLAVAAVSQWRYEAYTPTDGKLLSFDVPLTFSVP